MGKRLAELDKAIEEHLSSIIARRNWIPQGEFENSRYAYRSYVCGNMLFRAINDWGVMDLEVGSDESLSSFRSASGLRDLLDPPASGRWNMALKAAGFVDEHWAQVVEILGPHGAWRSTIGRIDEFHRKCMGFKS